MARKLPVDQDNYIRLNAEEMTVREMAKALDMKIAAVYDFCYANGISFKRDSRREPSPPPPRFPFKHIHKAEPQEEEDRKPSFTRPPAVYSNRSPYGIASSGK